MAANHKLRIVALLQEITDAYGGKYAPMLFILPPDKDAQENVIYYGATDEKGAEFFVSDLYDRFFITLTDEVDTIAKMGTAMLRTKYPIPIIDLLLCECQQTAIDDTERERMTNVLLDAKNRIKELETRHETKKHRTAKRKTDGK